MPTLLRIPLLVLLACALPLVACGDEAEVETVDPVTEAPAPMDQGALATERNTVEVGLTEYEINMPTTIPAGPTTFSITNNGSLEHNFEIEGQGVEQMLATPLQPGGTATLNVDLPPGTYRVYCPVADHATAHGMEMQLQVTPAGASTAGTTTY